MPGSTAERALPQDVVLVLAPLGRDAFVVQRLLAEAGIIVKTAASMLDVVAQLGEGVGTLVLTEEALGESTSVTSLLEALAAQPPWSDVPIVLLLGEGVRDATSRRPILEATRHLTILERPTPPVTLITAVQMALSARRRQYEVRDLLVRERRAREHAEESTRIKDEFLASISHELRTPLSAILLWSQLVEAGRITGNAVIGAARSIAASARAQSALIEDLLDQSRMLGGKLRITMVPQPLGPILLAAADIVRPTATAKGVAMELELDGADTLVQADAERVQQIVWNLLTNAVKFTPPGGRVSLRLTRDEACVIVTVEDTGEGIPAELLDHVFDRFRQGGGEGRRGSGLGLGLSIASQLVELHGGTLAVSSAGPGTGATFTMRLPALRAPPDAPPCR